MTRRLLPATLAVVVAVALCGATGVAQTRYDYGGGGRYTSTGDPGFLVFFEAGLANPRNTDNIVAATGPNVIIPEWDDELAGRFGLGYRFSNGHEVVASFWGFEAEQSEAMVGTFEFPIGPTEGFSFDLTTEVQARAAEASWIIPFDLTDSFRVEASAGLRYAGYEETTDGTYGTSIGTVDVYKSLEGTMLGVRLGGRATYSFGSWFTSVGAGLSMLDGELEASTSLSPQPPGAPPLHLVDDSRSGTILELDVRGGWRAASDKLSLWVGWEQQEWQQIAADLARNLPGNDLISRSRDSVSFSWFKAGASYRF